MSDYTNNIGIKISVRGGKNAVTTLDKLTASLYRINLQSGRTNTGFNSAMESMNKALKETSKTADEATSSTVATFTKLGKIALIVKAVKIVAKAIGSCVNESMSYVENLNLFTTIMGKYADEALNYANAINSVVGIDTSEWIYNEGVFMSLAKGFGIAGEQAAFMSEQLTQLGYDIASFYNISTETAMLKLKSGFSGELEPLRNIGYDLSQAKLKEIAKSIGVTKSFTDMTQAEKAQLRYIAIMTQLTEVQGDMAKTLQSPANQLRLLKTAFTQLTRSIGNAFMPLVQKLLPLLTQLTGAIKEAFDMVADAVGYVAVTFDNETEGVSALTDDLDEATESAKALKKQLAGFDELNNLSTSSSTSTSTQTEFSLSTDELEKYSYNFLEKLSNSEMAKGFVETRKLLGNLLSIVGIGLKYIFEIVGHALTVIQPFLSYMLNVVNTILEALISALNFVLPQIISALKSVISWLEPLIKMIQVGWEFIKPIFSTLLNVAFTIVAAVISIGPWIVEAVSDVIRWILDGIANIYQKIVNWVSNLIAPILKFFGIKTEKSSGGNTTTYTSLGLDKTKPITVTKLATGGVVNNPTLAMVGEDGKEAVVPLENNTGWINALGQSISNSSSTDSLLQTIINKIDGIDLQPTISVQDVGEASIHYINKKQRLLGGSVI